MTEFPSLYIRAAGPLLDDVTDLDLGDVDLLPLRPSSVTLEMVTDQLAKATIVVYVTPDVDVPAEVTLVSTTPKPAATGGRVDIDVQLQGGATVSTDALAAALESMRACRAQHGQIQRPQLNEEASDGRT